MKLSKLLSHVVRPRSADPDIARREFILNTFIAGIIGLLSLATISSTVSYFLYSTSAVRDDDRVSLVALLLLLAFFVSLFAVSRKGLVRLASYLLLATLFFFALYMSYRWGVDLQAALLFDVLVIVMAGILVSTSSAFYMTAAVCISIFGLGVLQHHGILLANRYWTLKDWDELDILIVSAVFAVIALVSWLSNREIERSLRRAHTSEALLREERDMLEIRVRERTEELRRTQMEQMTQAYRFVEFGRLAGGLFHELGNPLTALSLDIAQIADSHERGAALETFGQDLARARRASERVQGLMDSMRRHLARESPEERFSIPLALSDVVRVLDPYARTRQVRIVLKTSAAIETFGDPAAFIQALTSIISNAIEAYGENGAGDVDVAYELTDGRLHITVRDFGTGIPTSIRDRIFEPFFTTKGSARGLGIGLPLARRVIDKEFGGDISVHSPLGGTGSLFVISFPLRGHES